MRTLSTVVKGALCNMFTVYDKDVVSYVVEMGGSPFNLRSEGAHEGHDKRSRSKAPSVRLEKG